MKIVKNPPAAADMISQTWAPLSGRVVCCPWPPAVCSLRPTACLSPARAQRGCKKVQKGAKKCRKVQSLKIWHRKF